MDWVTSCSSRVPPWGVTFVMVLLLRWYISNSAEGFRMVWEPGTTPEPGSLRRVPTVCSIGNRFECFVASFWWHIRWCAFDTCKYFCSSWDFPEQSDDKLPKDWCMGKLFRSLSECVVDRNKHTNKPLDDCDVSGQKQTGKVCLVMHYYSFASGKWIIMSSLMLLNTVVVT